MSMEIIASQINFGGWQKRCLCSMGPNYARLAKTTVEGGTELVAYSMWFAASIEYFFQERLATAHLSHQGQRYEKHGFRHSIGRGGGVGDIV